MLSKEEFERENNIGIDEGADEFEDAMDEPTTQQIQEEQPFDGQRKQQSRIYDMQIDGNFSFKDNDGFTIHPDKRWHFDNLFVYESEDLKNIFQDADPGDTALTQEMLNYYPLESWLKFGKSKPIRLLYYPLAESGPWDYNKEEQQALHDFKQFCKSKGRSVPQVDGEILRALYGKKMDVEKTLADIDLNNQTFKDAFPLQVNRNVFELLNRGLFYICGRDRCYRPILVVKFAVFNEMPDPKPSQQDVITAVLLNCFFARKYMMLDGQIENQTLIVDLSGKFNCGLGVIKPIIKFFPQINKGRHRAMFALNCPITINVLWASVRIFLDEITQNKVQFSSTSKIPDMHKLIAPEQLEKKFGGKAPNRKAGQYWPPRLNSTNFGVQDLDHSVLSADKADLMRLSVLSSNDGANSSKNLTDSTIQLQYND